MNRSAVSFVEKRDLCLTLSCLPINTVVKVGRYVDTTLDQSK